MLAGLVILGVVIAAAILFVAFMARAMRDN